MEKPKVEIKLKDTPKKPEVNHSQSENLHRLIQGLIIARCEREGWKYKILDKPKGEWVYVETGDEKTTV